MSDEPERDAKGRWQPGQSGSPETKWGRDNPPPTSPGRPRKDAWIGELEHRLEDERIRQAMADRLVKMALKGSERAALQAINLIQDRIGGPVTKHIEADVRTEQRRIVIVGRPAEVPAMPDGVQEIERLRAEAEEQAQFNRENT